MDEYELPQVCVYFLRRIFLGIEEFPISFFHTDVEKLILVRASQSSYVSLTLKYRQLRPKSIVPRGLSKASTSP